MFKLEIKRSDLSIYWKENFNSMLEAIAWVTEEMTRPYWEAEFTYEITEVGQLVISADELRVLELKKIGVASRLMCQHCLDLIAGFNLERSLTAEQITTMQSTFGNIQIALMTSRPSSAKALISAIVPDEILITTEMKNLILAELAYA
jgi:hypothetical protein